MVQPVLNQDNVSGSVSVSMKVSAPDAQSITANFYFKKTGEEKSVSRKICTVKRKKMTN